ncbi:hypothetical protein [Metabacillus litoralis]|uniref:hypothetical protein n=1 Tax=Metabacillus litoralis TaxID=152268 RepID=UPI001CFE5F82|nr:hypothetical protein [Metabacillus litoralis]
MRYKYSIIEDPKSEYKKIKLPDELAVIEYLLYDMESFREAIFLENIENVLLGKSTSESTGGNICTLEINKEYTKVINDYVLEDGPTSCMIETEDLKSIIEIWVMENKDVLNNN